jgi:hypothetical protein
MTPHLLLHAFFSGKFLNQKLSLRLLSASLTLLLPPTLAAQSINMVWQDVFGGTNEERCHTMQPTSDSGFIVVGRTWSNNDDLADAEYLRQALLIKYDANGNRQWHKTYGGSSTDHSFYTEQLPGGNYLMALESQSSDGDVPENNGNQDFVWLKLDSVGDIIGEIVYGASLHDHPSCMRRTAAGNYIMVGGSLSNDGIVTGHHGTGDYFDIWVVMLDANGNWLWGKQIGGSLMDFSDWVQETPDGNFLITGETHSNDGDFPDHHGSTDYSDLFVIKMDPNGNILWKKIMGGDKDDLGEVIALTPDGGFVVVGNSASNNGDVTNPHGGYDAWLIKCDANGNIQWQKTYGGSEADYGHYVITTLDGGYALACESGSNDDDLTSNKGGTDHWFLKLDSDGDIEWQVSFGGSGDDAANAVIQATSGGFIVGGTVHSDDGDPETHHGSAEKGDTWVYKLMRSARPLPAPTGDVFGLPASYSDQEHKTALSENINGIDVSVYPNPAADYLAVSFYTSLSTNFRLELLNMDCITVRSTAQKNYAEGKHRISYDLSDLPAGNYLLRITNDQETNVRKVEVMR